MRRVVAWSSSCCAQDLVLISDKKSGPSRPPSGDRRDTHAPDSSRSGDGSWRRRSRHSTRNNNRVQAAAVDHVGGGVDGDTARMAVARRRRGE